MVSRGDGDCSLLSYTSSGSIVWRLRWKLLNICWPGAPDDIRPRYCQLGVTWDIMGRPDMGPVGGKEGVSQEEAGGSQEEGVTPGEVCCQYEPSVSTRG